MHDELTHTVAEENRTFVQGLDFYFENGMMILTRRYLLNRGACCDNKCRHCPYGENEPPLE